MQELFGKNAATNEHLRCRHHGTPKRYSPAGCLCLQDSKLPLRFIVYFGLPRHASLPAFGAAMSPPAPLHILVHQWYTGRGVLQLLITTYIP